MEAAGLLPKKRQKTTSSERQATGLKNMNFAGGQAVGVGVQRCACIAMPLSWSPLAFGSDSPLPTPSIALDVTPYCCGGGGKLLIFQSKRFAFCQRSLDRWLIPPGIAAALVSRILLTKKEAQQQCIDYLLTTTVVEAQMYAISFRQRNTQLSADSEARVGGSPRKSYERPIKFG